MLTPDSYMKNKKGIYVPIRKGKGFCPNPVARDGIPYFADSESNPEVVGTQKYEDYWFERVAFLLLVGRFPDEKDTICIESSLQCFRFCTISK